MKTADALERGRVSFGRQAWGDAYAQLSALDLAVHLEGEDLERLAMAAYLTGRDSESVDAWARAHHHLLRQNDQARAARCAFWLGMQLMSRGEMAQGGGWFARARRLLDEAALDCVEQGYLLLPIALQSLGQGNAAAAFDTFNRIARIGDRFGDLDLITLGRLGRGQALTHLGDVIQGVSLFDEAMIAVTSSEVSPIVAGVVYCAVIDACIDIFDLRRAHEWTAALSRWCAAQPDLVPYRGQCLVHRAEIMQLHGAWPDAVDEAQLACERLSGQPAVGAAFYQQAELYRLRGEFAEAEVAYRQANQWGRSPHPGLALMRLAQGQIAAADAAIRRVLDETHDRAARSRALPGYVEVMLAVRDVPSARAAASELALMAAELNAPMLHATSAHAQGAVLLAEGEARAACDALRRAWTFWQELEVPYEAARVRVLLGQAFRALGDEDTAAMELDAARGAFRQLGALPDLASLESLTAKAATRSAGGLTAREVEVLRLIAAGKTNRAIGDDLVISEKTVDRHVSNIFTKLRLSSRAAATAYAFEHDLL